MILKYSLYFSLLIAVVLGVNPNWALAREGEHGERGGDRNKEFSDRGRSSMHHENLQGSHHENKQGFDHRGMEDRGFHHENFNSFGRSYGGENVYVAPEYVPSSQPSYSPPGEQGSSVYDFYNSGGQ